MNIGVLSSNGKKYNLAIVKSTVKERLKVSQ